MSTKTNIAVLLATYNGERYLREQLDSLLAQTYENWELYIHDDGSSDSTLEIIREYAERFPEKIHLRDVPKCGSAKKNFMFLLNQADAPYVMFCDQDDYWYPEKIEKTLSEMMSIEAELGKDTPALVFTELRVVDENLNPLCDTLSQYQNLDCSRTNFEKLVLQNVATGCTMMINHSLLELVKTEKDEPIIMHDWWCALVASRFGVMSFIEEPLIDYRQHSNNSVGARNVSSTQYAKKRLKEKEKTIKILEASRTQAGFFAEKFQDDFSRSYSMLSNQNKLSRIHFYEKNDMWKKGIARNISLLIFG